MCVLPYNVNFLKILQTYNNMTVQILLLYKFPGLIVIITASIFVLKYIFKKIRVECMTRNGTVAGLQYTKVTDGRLS